ncbi:hypothetical protein RBB50_006251 [Rhinocladiella similis]
MMAAETQAHPDLKDKDNDAGVRSRAASSPKVKRMASIPEEPPRDDIPRFRLEATGKGSKSESDPEDDPPCLDNCEHQTQGQSEHVLEYVTKIREAIMLQGFRVQREQETSTEEAESEAPKTEMHEEKNKAAEKKKRESVVLTVSTKTKDALCGLKAKRQSIFGRVGAKSKHVLSGFKVSGESVLSETETRETGGSKARSVRSRISRALSARRGIGMRESTPKTETTRPGIAITAPPSRNSQSEKDDGKETRHIEFKVDGPSDSDDGEDAALLPAENLPLELAKSKSPSKPARRYRSPTPYGYRGREARLVRMSRFRKGLGATRGVVGDVKVAARNVLSFSRKVGGWSKL